jgi:hypothetical protein
MLGQVTEPRCIEREATIWPLAAQYESQSKPNAPVRFARLNVAEYTISLDRSSPVIPTMQAERFAGSTVF